VKRKPKTPGVAATTAVTASAPSSHGGMLGICRSRARGNGTCTCTQGDATVEVQLGGEA